MPQDPTKRRQPVSLGRWSLGGWRWGELGIWLAALMACAVGTKERAKPQVEASSTAVKAWTYDEHGCLNPPSGLLARWESQASQCGTLLVQDSQYPSRVGLLSASTGTTLAEGITPEACRKDACKFLSWDSKLGPLVVASLQPTGPQENPSQYWLGMRAGHHFSFVSLTPADVQAQAGEVVAPSAMLEPWKCGSDLALRKEASAQANLAAELSEREGRYVPDGPGWLVVPKVDWEGEQCERLALTF